MEIILNKNCFDIEIKINGKNLDGLNNQDKIKVMNTLLRVIKPSNYKQIIENLIDRCELTEYTDMKTCESCQDVNYTKKLKTN